MIHRNVSELCHQATRRRMPDDGILTVELFPVLYSPFLPVVLLHVFYIFLSSDNHRNFTIIVLLRSQYAPEQSYRSDKFHTVP